MSINLYAARVEGKSVRWVEELDDYEVHLSEHNASWLLGLIGIDFGNPDYVGCLSLDQMEELLEELAKVGVRGYEPSWSEQQPGEPLFIHCGRTPEQVQRYYRNLALLTSAARDNGIEVIAYA